MARQWSAKPSTAVRIRSRPQSKMKLIERRAFFVLKSEHIACVRAFEAKNSQSELHFVLIHHLTAADARRESAIYFCVKLARKQKESNKKQPLEAVFSIIACPSTTQ